MGLLGHITFLLVAKKRKGAGRFEMEGIRSGEHYYHWIHPLLPAQFLPCPNQSMITTTPFPPFPLTKPGRHSGIGGEAVVLPPFASALTEWLPIKHCAHHWHPFYDINLSTWQQVYQYQQYRKAVASSDERETLPLPGDVTPPPWEPSQLLTAYK